MLLTEKYEVTNKGNSIMLSVDFSAEILVDLIVGWYIHSIKRKISPNKNITSSESIL